jgi:hypothetical protein
MLSKIRYLKKACGNNVATVQKPYLLCCFGTHGHGFYIFTQQFFPQNSSSCTIFKEAFFKYVNQLIRYV